MFSPSFFCVARNIIQGKRRRVKAADRRPLLGVIHGSAQEGQFEGHGFS